MFFGFFYFLFFVLCVWKVEGKNIFYVYGNEKEYHNTSPGLAGMEGTPGIESATSYNLATIKTFTLCKAINQTLLSHARSRGRFPSNGADSTVHHQRITPTKRL